MAESALRAEVDYRMRDADIRQTALRMEHELDQLQLQATNRSITRAQWMALAVVTGAFSLAAYALKQGQALPGILFALATLTGLVATLFRGQAGRKQAVAVEDGTDKSPEDRSDNPTS